MTQSSWCDRVLFFYLFERVVPLRFVSMLVAGPRCFRNSCLAAYDASFGTFGRSGFVRVLFLDNECELLTVTVDDYRPNARFMFKRIPDSIVSEDKDLQKAHVLLQKLWSRMYRDVWDVVLSSWPSQYAMILEHLSMSTRREIFRVLQGAYVNISKEKLSQYLGCSVEQAVEYSTAHGATQEDTVVIMPRIPQEERLPESEIQKLQSILVQLGQ